MSRLGLSMIVKDEARVIAACLRSVVDHIAWWTVVDTGSQDGTQEIVRRELAGVPGELVERPWVDFGSNREEALQLTRRSPHAPVPLSAPGANDDYLIWIDADQTFEGWPAGGEAGLRGLDHDGYYLTVQQQDVTYQRLALLRRTAPWRWRGVLHEFLELDGATTARLDAPWVDASSDQGARSRDRNTYLRDIEVLESALSNEPDNTRYAFYLAQSYRDAGDQEAAHAAYQRRAEMDGWVEERVVARLEATRSAERLGHADGEVVAGYLRAHDVAPWRIEPLVELARWHRERDRFPSALLFARAACRLPDPGDAVLFREIAAATWRRWDELAIAAYWTGHADEGVDAAERALAHRPDDERLQANLAFCRELQHQQLIAAPTGRPRS